MGKQNNYVVEIVFFQFIKTTDVFFGKSVRLHVVLGIEAEYRHESEIVILIIKFFRLVQANVSGKIRETIKNLLCRICSENRISTLGLLSKNDPIRKYEFWRFSFYESFHYPKGVFGHEIITSE